MCFECWRLTFDCRKLLLDDHRDDIFFSCIYFSRAKVGELLPHVSSPKIYLQYAKAKEADGRSVRFLTFPSMHSNVLHISNDVCSPLRKQSRETANSSARRLAWSARPLNSLKLIYLSWVCMYSNAEYFYLSIKY